MALQKGERYRCPDANCGCEIEVTKGSKPGGGGTLNPLSRDVRLLAELSDFGY